MVEPIKLGGTTVLPGTRQTVNLPVAPLYTSAEMMMPVHIVHGRKQGPCLFVSAAIHGDEINGVEIIRRLLGRPELARLKGTLIAVPVVNVYGYSARSRYLPDRRDLNRSFPGSRSGSMAARTAHLFMEEIVSKATHGIDLHTGAIHRTNLPHVRVSFDQEESVTLARAFRVPLIMHSDLRDGSLRQAVLDRKVPILLYEAGEALRFDERAIRIGLRGVLTVMRSIGMLRTGISSTRYQKPLIATSSKWVRSKDSGTLIPRCTVGDIVREGDIIGVITDPIGAEDVPVIATATGVVVGQALLPLVYEGEALFNIAIIDGNRDAAKVLERYQTNLTNDPDLPPDVDLTLAHDPTD